MQGILYSVLVVLSAAAIGAGMVSSVLGFRSGIRLLQWKATAHLGMLIPVGVLLWLVIPARTVTPSVPAWFYVSGLLIAAVGSIGAVASSIRLELHMRFPDFEAEGRPGEIPGRADVYAARKRP